MFSQQFSSVSHLTNKNSTIYSFSWGLLIFKGSRRKLTNKLESVKFEVIIINMKQLLDYSR